MCGGLGVRRGMMAAFSEGGLRSVFGGYTAFMMKTVGRRRCLTAKCIRQYNHDSQSAGTRQPCAIRSMDMHEAGGACSIGVLAPCSRRAG
jgi:hypothetical protein